MKKFSVWVEYADKSKFNFDVTLNGKESEIYAELMMIVRGTLMASCASRIVAYNEDGLEVVSYFQ